MCGSSLCHMTRTCREGKWEGRPRIVHRGEAAPGARLGARTRGITNIIKKPPAPQVRCRHEGNNFWIPRLHHKNQEAGHTDRSQHNAHLLYLHGMWRTVHQHYDQSQLSQALQVLKGKQWAVVWIEYEMATLAHALRTSTPAEGAASAGCGSCRDWGLTLVGSRWIWVDVSLATSHHALWFLFCHDVNKLCHMLLLLWSALLSSVFLSWWREPPELWAKIYLSILTLTCQVFDRHNMNITNMGDMSRTHGHQNAGFFTRLPILVPFPREAHVILPKFSDVLHPDMNLTIFTVFYERQK